MHLGLEELGAFYRDHHLDDHLVLATVVHTEGSTYRKPGAMMLIAVDGSYSGMISGGCLEGDLLGHADSVFTSGQPAQVSYDLGDDEAALWGLGLGCGGAVHLLLCRFDRADHFGLLDLLLQVPSARQQRWLGIAVHSAGMAVMTEKGEVEGDGMVAQAMTRERTSLPVGRACAHLNDASSGGEDILIVPLNKAPQVLVCGGGPDALPLVELIAVMGWSCAVTDHRAAFADARRFPQSATVIHSRADNIQSVIDVGSIDAAVIMSHHLEHDEAYLRQLVGCHLSYLGLLGPRARRQQLEDALGGIDEPLFGPAGLDIGAELPASIALSIVAEIHAVLNRRDGQYLVKRS